MGYPKKIFFLLSSPHTLALFYIIFYLFSPSTATSWSEHESHIAIVVESCCFCNWNAMHVVPVVSCSLLAVHRDVPYLPFITFFLFFAKLAKKQNFMCVLDQKYNFFRIVSFCVSLLNKNFLFLQFIRIMEKVYTLFCYLYI